MVEKIEESKAVRRSYCELGVGCVGGWVGGWFTYVVGHLDPEFVLGLEGLELADQLGHVPADLVVPLWEGGWVGGWVGLVGVHGWEEGWVQHSIHPSIHPSHPATPATPAIPYVPPPCTNLT